MFKILTLLTLAASPLAAFHPDPNVLFLHEYAEEKRRICLETIDHTYSDDLEVYLLGKADAYTDMMYMMNFVMYEDCCP